MPKMLVLINRLDLECHLSEIKEIAKTYEIAKAYLAKVSPDFGSRVRSMVAPYKLDMAARMSDAATSKYLSQMAGDLHKDGVDCEIISTSIPGKRVDDFIGKNNIDLVLTSDGRSGLCRWPGGGLAGRHVQFLYDHAFTDGRVALTRDVKTKSDVKKMLVLLNHLDIEERLPELRNLALTQRVESVYLASVSRPFSPDSRTVPSAQGLHPVERVVVYLVRVSRAFGSRVRSRVSPQKLDMAARMSDAAARKHLLKIANALAAEGIDAVPIGVGIPAEKIEEYIEKNNIDLVVTGDGRSGLCSWHSSGLAGINLCSVYEGVLAPELVLWGRFKAKARHGLRTLPGIALQFGALLLFWLVLSSRYEAKYLVPGAVMAALVTYFTHDLFSHFSSNPGRRESLLPTVPQLWRFLSYLPGLLLRIVLANMQVAYLVLHPRMPIGPAFLRFKTHLQRSAAQVLLANSITLTPGTVTVDLRNGVYTVHALVPLSAYELVTGQVQNRVGAIFGERREEPPDACWCLSIGEVEK